MQSIKKQGVNLFFITVFLLYLLLANALVHDQNATLLQPWIPILPSLFFLAFLANVFSINYKLLLIILVAIITICVFVPYNYFSWLYWGQYTLIMMGFAVWFWQSLLPNKQPLCTQFAHQLHEIVSDNLAKYTRHVTQAWVVFFVSMTLISSGLFLFVSVQSWALFTFFMTGPLIGIMFTVEYLIRKRCLPPADALDLMSAIKGYQLFIRARINHEK